MTVRPNDAPLPEPPASPGFRAPPLSYDMGAANPSSWSFTATDALDRLIALQVKNEKTVMAMRDRATFLFRLTLLSAAFSVFSLGCNLYLLWTRS